MAIEKIAFSASDSPDAQDALVILRRRYEEVAVDEADAIYGKPKTMYQRDYMNRDIMYNLYGDTPEKKYVIEQAREIDPRQISTRRGSDMVQIYEAWHLPSGVRGAKNYQAGRHVIGIDGATLLDEEWTKEYYPFRWLLWTKRRTGMWGQGLAAEIVGIQLEINQLLFNRLRRGKGS